MPNRKYKSPQEGDLVTVRQNFLFCGRNGAEELGHKLYKTYGSAGLKPEIVNEGTVLMFLGTLFFQKEEQSQNTTFFVYKFLADGRIIYSEPTIRYPKQWLAWYVKVTQNNGYET